MSEHQDDLDWETALRDGLRRLSPPPVSKGFDSHVLAGLTRPLPWWQRIGREARPLLAGMACSCSLMLAAVSWSVQIPSAVHPPSHTAVQAMHSLDIAALNTLLDRPGLSAASLNELAATPPMKSMATPAVHGLRSPKRRASRSIATVLV